MLDNVKKQIADTYYWDARVTALECNYFGDEVRVTFEDDKNGTTFLFENCYTVKIRHTISYLKERPTRELGISQIPYFMQAVEVNMICLQGNEYMEFKINMHPVELYVVCKKFAVC